MKDYATVERIPTMEGKLMIMVLMPKPLPTPPQQKKQNAKTENKQDGSQEVQDHGNREDNPAPVPQQPPVPT